MENVKPDFCISCSSVLQIRTMASLIKDKAFINGAWVSATSGKTFEVTNPVNGKVIASVPDMDAIDANKAIDAAHEVIFLVLTKSKIS